mmetsp:Transcript_19918/g.49702  ORF Transcript_19918/g.49702 Transcript_19918/m.49702 type:complete len:224 (+) Transcript_19918:693-1364(+)
MKPSPSLEPALGLDDDGRIISFNQAKKLMPQKSIQRYYRWVDRANPHSPSLRFSQGRVESRVDITDPGSEEGFPPPPIQQIPRKFLRLLQKSRVDHAAQGAPKYRATRPHTMKHSFTSCCGRRTGGLSPFARRTPLSSHRWSLICCCCCCTMMWTVRMLRCHVSNRCRRLAHETIIIIITTARRRYRRSALHASKSKRRNGMRWSKMLCTLLDFLHMKAALEP